MNKEIAKTVNKVREIGRIINRNKGQILVSGAIIGTSVFAAACETRVNANHVDVFGNGDGNGKNKTEIVITPTTTTVTETKPAVTTTVTTTPATTETTKKPEATKILLAGIPVPSNLSEIGTAKMNSSFPEGQWINPIYNSLTADAAHNWEGIGPHYPIAFENIDPNAANISTHGNVGEIIVVSDKGGMVMVAFMQESAHQKDGAWATDQNGNLVKGDWEIQYNFHALAPNQEIWVVDPDTGKQLFWPDGSPVVYRANELGIASFEVPATCGECGIGGDVRFGLMFEMPASIPGTQATEIKIERGANNHPELKGENPLPTGVIKPAIPGN